MSGPSETGRFYMPTRGPADWADGLADRSQWVARKSAYELAHAWELASDGIPAPVRTALRRATNPALHDLHLVLGLPEHRVEPGDGLRASQTDLFALARGSGGLVAMAVEGKESEPFGDHSVEAWLNRTKTGTNRLRLVCDAISLDPDAVSSVRYQLLHRTASAVIEAQRFRCDHALMLVHSFSPERKHFDAFREFVRAYGREAAPGDVLEVARIGDVRLHLGWVSDVCQPARGPFTGQALAHLGLAELRSQYLRQPFWCERDVEAVMQRALVDLVSCERLPLTVHRNQHIRPRHGPTKQVDLVVRERDGRVRLALELKYEPSPRRPDLRSPSGRTPEKVTDWGEIRADIAAMRSLVGSGDAETGVAIVIDEGSRLQADMAPDGATWELWGELAGASPAWLAVRALVARFPA